MQSLSGLCIGQQKVIVSLTEQNADLLSVKDLLLKSEDVRMKQEHIIVALQQENKQLRNQNARFLEER